jgi:hypothetical protein
MFRIRLPHFQRNWKWPKVLIALMVLELGGTVPALALFGIASPNLYRTALWRIGSDNGFNSSPLQILYAYANYRPIPKTPFVWSQTYVPLPPLPPKSNQISNPILTILSKQINRLQRRRLRALYVRAASKMCHVHPAHLVPHPRHNRQPRNRNPLDRLDVRPDGTRSFRPQAPVEHSLVHLEKLFLRKAIWELSLLSTSKRSVCYDCGYAVRPYPLSPTFPSDQSEN